MTPQLSIVIPAYNEAAGLVSAIQSITESVEATGLSFELIVVDDGSTDQTWQVLLGVILTHSQVRALRLSRNFGKEGAIAAGLDVVKGEAAIVLDADLQHPPSLIAEMVRLWQSEGWEVVEAVKSHRGSEFFLYRILTRTFYRLAEAMTGHDTDASDFKLLDRRVIDGWRRFGERATFFRGLVGWLGFRRTQVFFEVPVRAEGQSRWSFGALAGLALHAVTSFSAVPLQVVTLLGAVTLVLAIAFGLQALRLWYQGTALPGFTTVILLQLIIGGFLMISLGIIGSYVARIYDEVKARPRYVIRELAGKEIPAGEPRSISTTPQTSQ